MKAGEYVGADGRLMEWRRDVNSEWRVWEGSGPRAIRTVDIRPATAALVALADELETEVFALDEQTRLRVRDNDVLLERALGTAPVWAPSNTGEADRILAAFRAGRWREKA
jgi:hypothetical protein